MRIHDEDGGEPKRIGEIEVWYLDGSRAADTLGYHCAAIVFDPVRVGITDENELELIPTKSSSLSALTGF